MSRCTRSGNILTWQTPKDAGATFSYQVPDAKRTVIAVAVRCAGRFILATNVLDIDELTDDDVLREYKAQQSTERGFRFLKDPLFFTSSVFLNSTERVAALAMVVCAYLFIIWVRGHCVKLGAIHRH